MSDLQTGRPDALQVCPQCTSTMIETNSVSLLGTGVAGDATCLSCGWKGKVNELASVPFNNPFGDQQGSVEAFGREMLLSIVQQCAEPIGRVLIRWGFLDGKNIDKRLFVQYLTAISKAAVMAVIELRVKQEKRVPS